jgi:uncharacterized protein YceK
MNKLIALVAIAAALSGCGSYRRVVANITGYTPVCVAHVEYLQFPHGVAVQRSVSGNVVSCS